MRRQRQPEPLQQDSLMLCRLGNASAADVDARLGRQHHVHHLYLRYLVEHLSRLIAQAGPLAHLPQRLPQHICQEAYQNVRLHPLFLLMPDRADRQIALLNAKGRFGLSELDVGLPQFLGSPVRDVAPQQVASLAQAPPSPARLDLRPDHHGTAIRRSLTSTLNRPAARLFSPSSLPTRCATAISLLALRLPATGGNLFKASSRSASRSARASPSLSPGAGQLRQRMNVSSPSGQGHSFTSSPSSNLSQPCSSSSLSKRFSWLFGVPRMYR